MYSEDKSRLLRVGMLLFWSNVGQDSDVASGSDSLENDKLKNVHKQIVCDSGKILFMEAMTDIVSCNAGRGCSANSERNSWNQQESCRACLSC
jgi:hypothetical protein